MREFIGYISLCRDAPASGGRGRAGDGTGAGAWTLIASPPHLASRRRLPHVQSLSFCVLTFYFYFTPCSATLNVPLKSQQVLSKLFILGHYELTAIVEASIFFDMRKKNVRFHFPN